MAKGRRKSNKSRSKRKSKSEIAADHLRSLVHVENPKGTVHVSVHAKTINIGRSINGTPEMSEKLDWANSEFKADPKDPRLQDPDPEPPGPMSMDKCTVHGNLCSASDAVCIQWVSRPHLKFSKNYLALNHAAIQLYGLKTAMPVLVATTPGHDAIRLYLGQETFPNKNAINKCGFFRLIIKGHGRSCKHVSRLDERTGEVWTNPDWLYGVLQGSKRDKFPLMEPFSELDGSIAPLYYDKRFQRDGRFNVLYSRMREVVSIPEDDYEKTRGLFADVVTARREWQTGSQSEVAPRQVPTAH